MADVLFEVTQDHLETGMRGYPVGYCVTSSVDPDKGLFYMGQPLGQMANWRPEEVIYLLYHGHKGSDKEVKAFSDELAKRSKTSPAVFDHVRKLPRQGHPMKLFCAALLVLGMIEGTGDYREDCLNVIAKIPELVATVINYHAGWGGTNPSQPELGYMENFTHMLNVPGADLKALTDVMRLFNVLHYDHGGGNLSTFVGKAVASGLEDMYGSLTAAMTALAGPRHGKANQDCLAFVKQVHDQLGDNATEAQMEELIRRRLASDDLIFGFGHAVLRVEDPRATVLFQVAQERYPGHPLVKIASLLRSAGEKVLGENPKIKDPHVNVDAISGTLLSAAGFPFPDYFTVLFGLSRVVGIAIQIVYERLTARGGKGTPIVRPKYIFKSL
ncbi:MAG: citrate (Si)-synthase [Chlamydiales bacterium]|nr:citrate (Si)-synthase [Chlamydiales bacterium]